MSTWHYTKNGAQTGPITTEALLSMIQSGEVPASTLVWKEGLPGWVAANTLPEFAGTVPPPAPSPAAPPVGQADVDKNKVFAVLAYIGILVLVPLLAAKESPFARYHTNQGLILVILWFGASFALSIIPVLGWALLPFACLGGLVLAILGIVHAVKGECKPLPLIGGLFTLVK